MYLNENTKKHKGSDWPFVYECKKRNNDSFHTYNYNGPCMIFYFLIMTVTIVSSEGDEYEGSA